MLKILRMVQINSESCSLDRYWINMLKILYIYEKAKHGLELYL